MIKEKIEVRVKKILNANTLLSGKSSEGNLERITATLLYRSRRMWGEGNQKTINAFVIFFTPPSTAPRVQCGSYCCHAAVEAVECVVRVIIKASLPHSSSSGRRWGEGYHE